MKNIAVLASGNGSNFEAIARSVKQGDIKANLKLLLTDKENAFVRQRAKRNGVRDIFVDPKGFSQRVEFDKEVVRILKQENVDLVVLAGYMRILSPYFVEEFRGRVFNIHPALLPAFKGENAIERAYRYGCKLTGVTVHFVDEEVDHGPIVLQGGVEIEKGMSLEELENKVHKVEHRLYLEAINLFLEEKVKVNGRNVDIE